MKVAIMQPYLLPYLGYFQLINAADKFVVYDNIQYTKKGWINRNAILKNGSRENFVVPLKKDSDYLDIVERDISPAFDSEKLLRIFEGAYKKAPYYSETQALLENIVRFRSNNLFSFLNNSIFEICSYLDVQTDIIRSSTVNIDHTLKAQEKVLAICEELQATNYLNPIGGLELYSTQIFAERHIELKFISMRRMPYSQGPHSFVPNLSIVDTLMFLGKDIVITSLNEDFDIITP